MSDEPGFGKETRSTVEPTDRELIQHYRADRDRLAARVAELEADLAGRDIELAEVDLRVEALTEALRELVEHIELNGGCHRGCDQHDIARAVLSAADRPEETTP